MKYDIVIEQLKKSTDHNVKAFVKDVENMKRLTEEQKYYLLDNQQCEDSVRILVNDFIPYIMKVAFQYSLTSKTASVLDLINEGIIGAYAAFNKFDYSGKTMLNLIRSHIKRYIKNMALMRDCQNEVISIIGDLDHEECVEERSFLDRLDGEKKRSLLNKMFNKHLGDRNTRIILEYYTEHNLDYKSLAIKYNLSGECIRKITKNFTPLHKQVVNLWGLFSSDFDLPVNEAKFRRSI